MLPERSDEHGNGRAQWIDHGVVYLLVLFLIAATSLASVSQMYSREALIADARQLARVIETSHPDPFARCGGRIPFYLKLNQIVNAIPEDGATQSDFIRSIRPLVAMVGDAHTIVLSDYDVSAVYPGGVPFRFGVVERSLYVAGVLSRVDEGYLGDILVSVEGVPVEELMTRLRSLVGLENDYHVLLELAERTLWYGPYLADVLPEWMHHGAIRVALRRPDGTAYEVAFTLPRITTAYRTPPSAVTLPAANSAGFFAGIIDVARSTGAGRDKSEVPAEAGSQGPRIGYVRIDHQGGARECIEENTAAGAIVTTAEERARIPSATDAFRDLVVAMADAKTDTLVVDVRSDVGGTDTVTEILIYFLYGYAGMKAYMGEPYIHDGFSAVRYSELYFANCPNESIDQVNEGRTGVPLVVGEYVFDDYRGRAAEMRATVDATDVKAYLLDGYADIPSFYDEFAAGTYAGHYCPRNVVVLVSPKTFSSGSTTMTALDLNGAILVGTPSGQSCSAFGNATLWTLDATRIQGLVARSYYNPYPDDPERSEVWPIDVPMTYETLASYGFDPNADLLLALDRLADGAP